MKILKISFGIVIWFLSVNLVNGQPLDFEQYRLPGSISGISLYHIKSDTLMHGPQNIFMARFQPDADKTHHATIIYADSLLKRTSQFARESKALLALNGSFFDVEKGGSVAYMEFEGKRIAMNRDSKKKWAKTDSLLNGAIVIDQSDRLHIEISRGGSFYDQSPNEKAVMVSGPILIAENQLLPLENSAFVTKKHPRSCLCETNEGSILFIAIDGRSDQAAGMNLKELQLFLQRIRCKDAINLDGGGSTTLWINDGTNQSIINQPSDKEGERPVANIIAILKVEN